MSQRLCPIIFSLANILSCQIHIFVHWISVINIAGKSGQTSWNTRAKESTSSIFSSVKATLVLRVLFYTGFLHPIFVLMPWSYHHDGSILWLLLVPQLRQSKRSIESGVEQHLPWLASATTSETTPEGVEHWEGSMSAEASCLEVAHFTISARSADESTHMSWWLSWFPSMYPIDNWGVAGVWGRGVGWRTAEDCPLFHESCFVIHLIPSSSFLCYVI